MLSRIERVLEVAMRCCTRPSRIIGAIAASRRGGVTNSCPLWPACRFFSQLVARKTWANCQKVANTPNRKTPTMTPFR